MPQIKKMFALEIILSKGLDLLPSSSIEKRVLKKTVSSKYTLDRAREEHLWHLNGASSPHSCNIQIATRSSEHGLPDLKLVPLLC